MGHGTAKVAISMPQETFRSIERARRKLKLSRSEAVVDALRAWLAQQQEQARVRQYIEGYQRHPESRREARAWTQLATPVFRQDPW
ncbi:MAG: ribbon-helix-helix protein, CopG family [Candidatus Omnitrophica bacterium]|nr:ribbon-helix-helix protein, CopG family [Candidatus Omnitrophota bacterium]